MPMSDIPKPGMPSGALPMLILRVLQSGSCTDTPSPSASTCSPAKCSASKKACSIPRCKRCSSKGWVTAEWGISETNRKVRCYRLTPEGRKHLKAELSGYDRVTQAIQDILRTA
jgi:PadR family transcriptional regulator PadR